MGNKMNKSEVKKIYEQSHEAMYNQFKNNKIKLGEYFYLLKKEIGHGNFELTILNKFPYINKRTVQRYIQAYKNYNNL
jgi:hypothetical protein